MVQTYQTTSFHDANVEAFTAVMFHV